MNYLLRILFALATFPNKLKILYKKKKFQSLAKMGQHVTFGPMANISKESEASISIGSNCDLLCTLCAQGKGIIEIGNYTTIRGYSVVGAVERITIGDYVIISNNVHIYDNNNHPTPPLLRLKLSKSGFYGYLWSWVHSEHAPVVIEDNVWIGERSTVLKGVRIGRGSIVACDSVVTKSVPPYCIVAGNPAKIVKYLETDTTG